MTAVLAVSALVACPAEPEGAGDSPTPAGSDGGGTDESPKDNPVEHVVFLVKENRTFDHYFGRYPGADGVTRGELIDGRTIPLAPAQDVQPHDINHSFAAGLFAINGGKMNGFNVIQFGEDLSGYVQFRREGIPNYWRYADRFVLADRFFTSMYGPTLPEHLYTVAAQAYGIVANRRTQHDRDIYYCDDPKELTHRFPDDLAQREIDHIMRIEEMPMGEKQALLVGCRPLGERSHVRLLFDPRMIGAPPSSGRCQ